MSIRDTTSGERPRATLESILKIARAEMRSLVRARDTMHGLPLSYTARDYANREIWSLQQAINWLEEDIQNGK